jgi:hypothetical protein
MSWIDYLPTKAKWLKLIPIIVTDKVLKYIRHESRWWVIVLIFTMVISINFRGLISEYLWPKDPVKISVQSNAKISEKLVHVLEASHASRAYIFQFHNGMQYYTGQHAQRFSLTHEVVAPGVSRESDNLQNLQVSIFSWWIAETLNGRMIYKDLKEMNDYTTRVALEQQGVKSVFCLPLIAKGKVVGIIGVDYTFDENHFIEGLVLNEWFQNQANEISQLLIGAL